MAKLLVHLTTGDCKRKAGAARVEEVQAAAKPAVARPRSGSITGLFKRGSEASRKNSDTSHDNSETSRDASPASASPAISPRGTTYAKNSCPICMASFDTGELLGAHLM